MAASGINGVPADSPRIGLLTKTVVRSPVIRWILPARIRHRALNDVVFVGDDYIEVKSVKDGGHLDHLITKTNFGSRICSAGVFSIEDLTPSEDDYLQASIAPQPPSDEPSIPPQLLLLVLSAPEILFLYLDWRTNNVIQFKHQYVPLPKWPNPLHQAGEHLAIDPQCRAVAIAAMEEHVILFAAKPHETVRDELRRQQDPWCPIQQQQPLRVDGAIQHVAFLNPTRKDLDHIILVIVVVKDRRTRLHWYDWRTTSGIKDLQQHDPVPLDLPRCVTNLLIPLCNANFILTHGREMSMFSNLLSGTPRQQNINHIDNLFPPKFPAISPRYPMWINWCRPSRTPSATQDRDSIYLAREDGNVFLIEVQSNSTTMSSFAGDLKCHVGEAVASLGDHVNPDLIAVGGDTSMGRIVSIGAWSTQQSYDNNRTRVEALDFAPVEMLPNWTPVTDMIVSKPGSSKSAPTRDSVYMVSGKQPYGTITEIRKGVEARIFYDIDVPELRVATDIWALPDSTTGSIVLLTTTPTTTDIFVLSQGRDGLDMEQVYGSLDTTQETILATTTSAMHLLQVCPSKITITNSISAGFEDVVTRQSSSGGNIVKAAFVTEQDMLFCAERTGNDYTLTVYACRSENAAHANLLDQGSLRAAKSLKCETQPLAMAAAELGAAIVLIVAMSDGSVHFYICREGELVTLQTVQRSQDISELCDSMVLLRPTTECSGDATAVCGLRNGMLLTFSISLDETLSLSNDKHTRIGQSTVKVVKDVNASDQAYLFCGNDTCHLSLHGASGNITVNNIWATDKARPGLTQEGVKSCAKTPAHSFFAANWNLGHMADSLVLINNETFWFTTMERNVSTVSRQIPVDGSPFRLIYARVERCWVCASIVAEVRSFANEDRRQVFPIVQFIGKRQSTDPERPAKTYILQPGEKIYTMLEWTPQLNPDKTYAFVLVGGMYLKHDVQKGRIYFLQPNMSRDDAEVQCQHKISFEAPVFAMALYDNVTFVACYGRQVALYRFSFDTKSCRLVCLPYSLASRAQSVSCAEGMIYITTSDDSMVVLAVDELTINGSKETHVLRPITSAPRPDFGVSHTILDLENGDQISKMMLMSTREQELVGMALPASAISQHSMAAKILVEARLTRSLTKLHRGRTRPPWRQVMNPGVLVDEIIGSCPDGSVIGMSLINEALWRRLFWLQRLCEWSSVISPHTFERPLYTMSDGHGRMMSRPLPIGLGENSQLDIMTTAPDHYSDRARDMHIDGDLLAAALHPGSRQALRDKMVELSRKKGRVGEWMAANLQTELAALDGLVKEVGILLESWL